MERQAPKLRLTNTTVAHVDQIENVAEEPNNSLCQEKELRLDLVRWGGQTLPVVQPQGMLDLSVPIIRPQRNRLIFSRPVCLARHEDVGVAFLTYDRVGTMRADCISARETMALRHWLAILARSATRPRYSPVDWCVGPVVNGVVALAEAYERVPGHDTRPRTGST